MSPNYEGVNIVYYNQDNLKDDRSFTVKPHRDKLEKIMINKYTD